eukprot:TRINITY_DN12732_c0_g1_i1.p1 TRINITY_DN12732_c0_g1~~TRINITY_DN12732_c0_g1_i1.p1  ORF type:complete len:118 (+),score=31.52 TRINITY_DN12732_c0_g1_i1:58-411(+)
MFQGLASGDECLDLLIQYSTENTSAEETKRTFDLVIQGTQDVSCYLSLLPNLYRKLSSMDEYDISEEQLCTKLRNSVSTDYMRSLKSHHNVRHFEDLRKSLLEERATLNLGTSTASS